MSRPHTSRRATRRKARPPRYALGAAPGSLKHEPGAAPTVVRTLSFDPQAYEEIAPADVSTLGASLERWPTVWIDVDGLGDRQTLEQIAEVAKIHPLALEDVVTPTERSKVERYAGHHFLVLRMPTGEGIEDGERLCLFLGRGYVVTFQGDRPGDCLESVRARIRDNRGRVRVSGADYLAYALVDAIVDHYFPLADALETNLEQLEREVLGTAQAGLAERIHATMRDVRSLRRALVSVRDVVGALQREPSDLITDDTRLYLRDCLDHAVELHELTDTMRERAQGLMDLHLTMQNARLSGVMRLLAVVTTIFTPLTFIAGIYGMNFDRTVSRWNMPELGAPLGYPLVLTFMFIVATTLMLTFWWRGWLRPITDLQPAEDTGWTPLFRSAAAAASDADGTPPGPTKASGR